MAQDAYVKEAEMLTAFASDVRNAGNSMAGLGSRLSSITFMKENELRVYVNRIENALQQALQRLDEATYEYECYIRHADSEHYSQAEADSLYAEMENARSLCAAIDEDLNLATQLSNKALFELAGLRGIANGFATQVTDLAESAATNIYAAAHEIIQYKSIR